MKQKTISLLLHGLVIGAGICLAAVYMFFVPAAGHAVDRALGGEFSYCFLPWLIFLWMTAIPCFAALFPLWKS